MNSNQEITEELVLLRQASLCLASSLLAIQAGLVAVNTTVGENAPLNDALKKSNDQIIEFLENIKKMKAGGKD